MTDAIETTIEAPAKRKPAKRKAHRRAAPAAAPRAPKSTDSEFAGITAKTCCAACTPERCVISTVNVCKHPNMTSDAGCGPVTMANRMKARSILKHQKVDEAA